MSYIEVEYPAEKGAFYNLLCEQIKLYSEGETDPTAILANASSVIKQAFSEANWTGFYIVDGDSLKLGPFQGRPAVTRIKKGNGVCGTAWARGESIVVEEVECFEGHIACDCNTHSEIVVPIKNSSGEIFGVIDMDSVIPAYFDDADREGLEKSAEIIAKLLKI